jgi:hypothetical protein
MAQVGKPPAATHYGKSSECPPGVKKNGQVPPGLVGRCP